MSVLGLLSHEQNKLHAQKSKKILEKLMFDYSKKQYHIKLSGTFTDNQV